LSESLGEVVLRIFLRAIFEGIFYGLRAVWFGITGQGSKRREAQDRYRNAQKAQRRRLERAARRRGRKR
jgi:hypothetical protein